MGEPGTNWTSEEEIQLCMSWARCTICPITGNSITLTGLWEKIHADFVDNWTGPTAVRTPQALSSHFKPLKKMLKEWHNAKLQTRHHRPSGTNQLDEAHQVQLNFIAKTKKQFIHYECWEAVKDHPYFKDPPTAPVIPVEYSTDSPIGTSSPINLDDDVVLETPSSSSGRPMGQKAAKEARRKGKKKDEGSETMAQAMLKIAEINKATYEHMKARDDAHQAHTQKMLELEEEARDARTMAMDTTNMTPDTKEWWKKRRTDIRNKTNPNSDCYRPLFPDSQ